MTNIMNTKSIYIPLLLTGLLAGCGKKEGGDSDHAHGGLGSHTVADASNTSTEAGAAATIPTPVRPASKLKEVKAEEAWKTPLNLALFTAQQYKGKRGYEGKIQAVVFALVEAGELGQATEVALLFPSEAGDEALDRVARAAAESSPPPHPMAPTSAARAPPSSAEAAT